MSPYDPERQAQWDQIMGRLRAISGVGALLLAMALAGPVLLKELPAYVMLLVAGPAIGYLLLWLFREPPPGWQPRISDQRLEQRYQRMRKLSVVHVMLFGSLSLLFILLILVGVFRGH